MSDLVVVYCRVSTREQGDSRLGLEAQLSACKEFCRLNRLRVIEHRFEVVSGKVPLQQRPIFLEVRNLCFKYKASLLIAKQDRLSRDELIWHSFISKVTFPGKYTPDLIIADNPNATSFELSIRAAVSAEERRQIGQRTKAALAELKKQGVKLGEAGRRKANSRFIDTTEARKLIVLMKTNGHKSEAVASKLNSLGLLNSHGNPWTIGAVDNVMHKYRKASLR